jgi:acyl-CoA reductase-like NAD-dependent aldehyde dehydrogenase
VFGGANPVAGPFFAFSVPEPTGVVAAVAPQQDSLLGLVSVIAPIICSGNTVVLVTSHDRPLPAVALAEALATSDLPGGVVNVLTGSPAEILPWLAEHGDVNALDLTGATADERAVNLSRMSAQQLIAPMASNYARWVNFPWLVVEAGLARTKPAPYGAVSVPSVLTAQPR